MEEIMKEWKPSEIRNIAVIGHGGSGKTSLVEALLFNGKMTSRLGKVQDGNTVTDFDPIEIKKQVSLSSSFAYTEWKSRKINLADTPGYGDFISDARAVLRGMDVGLLMINAASGVEVQTEKLWRFLNELKKPRAIFINKLNRENTSVEQILENINETLPETSKALINIPLGAAEKFNGIVDLISMKAHVYKLDDSGEFEITDIPEEMLATVKSYHEKLVEAVAESDDKLIEKYFETGDLSEEEILNGIESGIVNCTLTPIFCGAADHNIGIANLMDHIIDFLPPPTDLPPQAGRNPQNDEELSFACDESQPFSGLVVKTMVDIFAGKITIIRVFSGSLNAEGNVYNVTRNVDERIGGLVLLQGKDHPAIKKVAAGDIAAIIKLNKTSTGDTLGDKKNPLVYPPIEFPEPAIAFAVKPKSKADDEKLTSSLSRIIDEDPTLHIHRDEETHELLISGMGQQHIEVALEKMKRKFNIDVILDLPHVPYRETIKKKVEVQGKYKKQSGGRGQYGDTWLRLEPLPKGSGFQFVNEITGGAIPRGYIPAVEKGLVEAMKKGPLAGFPVVDLKITLYDGSYHDVDSSEMAFKVAASMGFKKGVMQSDPILLEPIMSVNVEAPGDYMGTIMGDISSRRGRVQDTVVRGKNQAIEALVPLSEVLQYAPDLKSMTSGRGSYHMEFSHYEEMPAHNAQKIIEEKKKEQHHEEH